QATKAADPSRLRTNISTLASERFGGRLTGTDGERLAREFIVAELKRIGAKPLPGQRDFALPFEFVAGARDGGTTLSIAGKARAARQHGAKAALVVTGPRSPNAGELVPMTFDTALSGSGIVAASIDGQAGAALMAAAGKTLADVQQSLDSGNPHVARFEIPG